MFPGVRPSFLRCSILVIQSVCFEEEVELLCSLHRRKKKQKVFQFIVSLNILVIIILSFKIKFLISNFILVFQARGTPRDQLPPRPPVKSAPPVSRIFPHRPVTRAQIVSFRSSKTNDCILFLTINNPMTWPALSSGIILLGELSHFSLFQAQGEVVLPRIYKKEYSKILLLLFKITENS